ncbi:hypothetical protein B7P43_G15139 [Cryptotermes secundus]|uniref:E3 SUMO-protein ligase NSE2 n=1 Tax=Cryptotermes secundus TaxID=105785 RepID=A0A2J7QSX9_9NEOP|nr:E3 SUMO-protein ligase NSE2 [Cryptotermes secundus]PNF31677.1 hypothetical protein B7P43_G15139 [Cryptotermes secundus]
MSCYSDEGRATQMKWTMESIKRCSELAIKFCDGEDRKEQLKKLSDLMGTCCFLDNKHGIAKASILNVQKILEENSGSGAGNSEGTDGHNPNVRELFNEEMEKRSSRAPNPKKHEKYINFIKNTELLMKAEVSGDDELTLVDAETLTVDPITKQRMTDPVRIKQCGHTFEKRSIMSLLKKRPHIRCPLPGCVQKSIRATDLEEHHELKLQLDHALKASGTDRIQ